MQTSVSSSLSVIVFAPYQSHCYHLVHLVRPIETHHGMLRLPDVVHPTHGRSDNVLPLTQPSASGEISGFSTVILLKLVQSYLVSPDAHNIRNEQLSTMARQHTIDRKLPWKLTYRLANLQNTVKLTSGQPTTANRFDKGEARQISNDPINFDQYSRALLLLPTNN